MTFPFWVTLSFDILEIMYQAVHWLFPFWFKLVNEIISLIICFYNFIFTLKQPSPKREGCFKVKNMFIIQVTR